MARSETKAYSIKICRVGESRHPIYFENFVGSEIEAENRMSDVWNGNTPSDGTRYRATLTPAGERRPIMTIGGR